MKKVFCIISVARQVQGEFICIKPEKAFTQASKADEYAKNLSKTYAESIQTPNGLINCICERGVFEITVED